MRLIAILALFSLTSCFHSGGVRLSDQRPSVEVADAAMAAGAPEVALHVADGLLKEHPGNSEALLRKGEAEYRLGDLDGARSSFETVISEEPGSFDAQLGLGRVELATHAAAAQVRFQRLAALQPTNVTVLTDLGIAYDLLGQHELAQKMYRAALGIAPDLVSARSNLGLSLALSSQPGEALQVLRPLDVTQAQSAQLRENIMTVLDAPRGEGAAAPQQTQASPHSVLGNAGL